MKIKLLLSTLLISFIGFTQSITVNTTTYTVPQLVTDVLVNSPCSQVRNITWRTGSNFGSSNGIGYFTNTNPNFPLSSGVILSTGDVMNAPGPNSTTLSDGVNAWIGDTDLENTLAAAGVTINSTNATVLEFDFTTFTTFFNFQFLFASEEYGTYQCQSPDGFAFLLTDLTTNTTTNLAVVPSTTTPISVQTIRDNLYNSACPSANSNYFGTFNGGSSAANSATNYNGQTVTLSASSSLVPNRSYHIKLVIADGTDTKFDSSILLGGNSFQFNQDVLGPDLTVANGTALCSSNGNNQSYTITSGLDPAIFNFSWEDQNHNPVGTNSPNLTINQPGTYYLTYSIISTGCVVDTNDIVIEYNSGLSTPNPENLYKCNSSLPSYTYDLTYNNTIVDPSNQYQISYHDTQNDADNNLNPLSSPLTTLSSSLPRTIWVRIFNPTTGCYSTKSFQLDLTAPPVANNPGDLTICETTPGSGNAVFNLGIQTSSVLNGQDPNIYNISYHTTQNDANTNSNPIDISNPLVSGNTTIYVRIETKTDPNCFNSISFNLVAKPRPTLDIIPDQYVCLQYILPNLTNPGTYYSGPNATGVIYPPGTAITTNQIIYIHHASGGTPSCENENSFEVNVVGTNDITPADINGCDSAALPGASPPGLRYFKFAGGPTNTSNVEMFPGDIINTIGTTTVYTYFSFLDPTCTPISSQFTITLTKTPTISNTFTNIFDCTQVSSLPTLNTDIGTANYYTFDSSTGVYTPLSLPITTTTHVYAFAENGICRSTVYDFIVYIGSLGLTNVDVCSAPYTLSPAPMGEYRDAPNGGGNIIPPGNISVNTRVYTFIPGASCTNNQFFDITFHQPSLTTPVLAPQCNNYTLPSNPEGGRYFTLQGGPATSGNVELFQGDVINTTTTIYIYKESTMALTPVCYNEIPWIITINPRPTIDSRGDQVVCYNYTLTPLVNGNYYDDPNGQNPITNLFLDASTLNANDDIPNRIKTIYIYAANPNDATCFSENSFTITFDGIEAADPGNQTACDSFTLPALPANMFYYDASHLSGGGNIIPAGTTYNSNNVISPIYIFTESNNRFTCKDENQFTITIINTPIANTVVTQPVCDNYKNNYDGISRFDLRQYETQVLGAQSPASAYNFKYFKTQAEALDVNATPINNPTQYENTIPFNETVWVRIANASSTNMCFAVTRIDLKINALPEPHLGTEYFICEDYATGTILNNVTIDSGISGVGYQFSWALDGSPFGGNTSSITTNQAGNYTVTITNTSSGCSNSASTVVTKYAPHIEIIYSDAFVNPSYITVNVIGNGSGNYEYQIDSAHYQDSNVFYNVSPGEHIVSVRDKDGHCSPAPVTALIVNYPKFFTPNGDGYNDIWNINDLAINNPNAAINIYDRYGKLIKQITPSTSGWNGTFNGQPLPSTDYWFTVEFNEKDTIRIFKAHFALKR